MRPLLEALGQQGICILDDAIPLSAYTTIDLSEDNEALKMLDLTQPDICQAYVDKVLQQANAKVAYGGYLECRGLYKGNHHFNAATFRNIHLGVDFWCEAGTKVLCPIDGEVHSFQNNATVGDYGPTIILKHNVVGNTFYTLYGHLSLESLDGLFIGKAFKKGETLGSLGTPDINVNYAPHLHFQIISDMENKKGDYPGVCAAKDLAFYQNNCPDPSLLFLL